MLDLNQTIEAWRAIGSDPELGPGYLVREVRQLSRPLLHQITGKPPIDCSRICLGACHICVNHKALTDYLDYHAPWWGWALRDWLDHLLEELKKPEYPEAFRWEPGGFISSPLEEVCLGISYKGYPLLLWRPGCWIKPADVWSPYQGTLPDAKELQAMVKEFDPFVMGQLLVDLKSTEHPNILVPRQRAH